MEQAGIPIIHMPDRGYGIMEGYHIPPVMFTEEEANAIIMAEKIIAQTKDESLSNAFAEAWTKIKSVMCSSDKAKADFLSERTLIGKNWNQERTSNLLSQIQSTLTHFRVLQLQYQKEGATTFSTRLVEPFAIYHISAENWVLIAWCRLRQDFRNFRLDRINQLAITAEHFTPHQLTLEEYRNRQRAQYYAGSND